MRLQRRRRVIPLLVWLATLLAMLILLVGCDRTGPVAGFCETATGPILTTPPPEGFEWRFAPGEVPGQFDRPTDETARQILSYNLVGRAVCRW